MILMNFRIMSSGVNYIVYDPPIESRESKEATQQQQHRAKERTYRVSLSPQSFLTLPKFQIFRPPVLSGHNHQQQQAGKQGGDYFVPVNQHKKSFRGEKM